MTNVQGLGMRLEGDFQSSEPTMAKPKRCVVMTETLMLSSEHLRVIGYDPVFMQTSKTICVVWYFNLLIHVHNVSEGYHGAADILLLRRW